MSAGECHLCGTVWTGDDNTDSGAHCDAVRHLKAELAKVTAERDERFTADEASAAMEYVCSDAYLLQEFERQLRASRATPTEGE